MYYVTISNFCSGVSKAALKLGGNLVFYVLQTWL